MKFTAVFFLLPLLAQASPVPIAKPEAEADAKAEAEALNLLGIELPALNLPGLNLPLLSGGAASGGSGTANPSTTSSAPISIPTDEVSSLLTPLLENLEVVAIVNLVNKILANSGLLPNGLNLLQILPNGVSGEMLDKIGTSLTQILQGIIPGTPTANLVKTLISTLQTATQIRPSPAIPGVGSAATGSATPGVVPGVTTLLETVLGLITNFNPAGKSILQIGQQLTVITKTLNSVTSLLVTNSGVNGLDANVVQNLLQQIIVALNNLLAGLGSGKQFLLLGPGLPLLGSLGNLLGGLGSVPGLNNVLQGLLGNLLTGLTPAGGSLGGLLTNLLNGVLKLLVGGNLGGGLGGLLNGLGLGGLISGLSGLLTKLNL